MIEAKKPIRCAIYTRKSTEEGLEQAFNSLHAQREACEAFIKSQAHEGWVSTGCAYDDGGHSGGSLDRPALQQLLSDIRRGKIDTVVVYKVDRLTRALTDFARIIETFEARRVSFVSITQSFSTTTSMGRLTLNVLLSFAQFEREIAGERIRDKIAASKRKGLWMGGVPPLGYDIENRKLIVNHSEAQAVQWIFRRYLELGSVPKVVDALRANGVRSKLWTTQAGRKLGGREIGRGALYLILRNRAYLGQIAHKGNIFLGDHAAIIDQTMWEQAKAILNGNRRRHASSGAPTGALLAGVLCDDRGNTMTPSYTKKRNGRRIRYYVSQALLQRRRVNAGSVPRVSALAIERLVLDQVFRRIRKIGACEPVHQESRSAMALIQRHIKRVELGSDYLEIRWHDPSCNTISATSTATIADLSLNPVAVQLHECVSKIPHCFLASAIGSKRRPRQFGLYHMRPNPGLVRAVARAMCWRELLESGRASSIEAIGRLNNCSRSYARSMLELAFLAPDIVESVLAGERQSMTVRRLLQSGVPLSWKEQRRIFAVHTKTIG